MTYTHHSVFVNFYTPLWVSLILACCGYNEKSEIEIFGFDFKAAPLLASRFFLQKVLSCRAHRVNGNSRVLNAMTRNRLTFNCLGSHELFKRFSQVYMYFWRCLQLCTCRLAQTSFSSWALCNPCSKLRLHVLHVLLTSNCLHNFQVARFQSWHHVSHLAFLACEGRGGIVPHDIPSCKIQWLNSVLCHVSGMPSRAGINVDLRAGVSPILNSNVLSWKGFDRSTMTACIDSF